MATAPPPPAPSSGRPRLGLATAVALNDAWIEPLLDPSNQRYVVYPIRHAVLWGLYKQHLSTLWTVGEIDFGDDRYDFETKLVEADRRVLRSVLAFFAAADGIVMANIDLNFENEVAALEARLFFGVQNMMEGVHAETYALLVETLVSDAAEKAALLNALDTMPHVRAKAAFAQRYMDPSRSFGERLVAFVCMEGLLFSASFAVVYYFKERNVMKGLTFSNELIARDEGLHATHGVALLAMLERPPSPDAIAAIVGEAAAVETVFVRETLGSDGLVGLPTETMVRYVRHVADSLLAMMRCAPLFHEPNPLDFMTKLSLDAKTNFFEQRVAEYSKSGVDAGEGGFGFDDVF